MTPAPPVQVDLNINIPAKLDELAAHINGTIHPPTISRLVQVGWGARPWAGGRDPGPCAWMALRESTHRFIMQANC